MSAASHARPSWQSDECPPWCVAEHREDDPPADRVHDSAGTYVTASIRRADSGEVANVELLLVASRRCGESGDWIFVGEPERAGQHLALTRESAARVAEALTALLAAGTTTR